MRTTDDGAGPPQVRPDPWWLSWAGPVVGGASVLGVLGLLVLLTVQSLASVQLRFTGVRVHGVVVARFDHPGSRHEPGVVVRFVVDGQAYELRTYGDDPLGAPREVVHDPADPTRAQLWAPHAWALDLVLAAGCLGVVGLMLGAVAVAVARDRRAARAGPRG